MGREDPQLKLRLTEELKSKVVEAAKANGRSVNAEIVARLEETFDGSQNLWDEVNRLSDALEEALQKLSKIEPEHKQMWLGYKGGHFGDGA